MTHEVRCLKLVKKELTYDPRCDCHGVEASLDWTDDGHDVTWVHVHSLETQQPCSLISPTEVLPASPSLSATR